MGIRNLSNIALFTFSPVVTKITLGPQGGPMGSQGGPFGTLWPWGPVALGDPLVPEDPLALGDPWVLGDPLAPPVGPMEGRWGPMGPPGGPGRALGDPWPPWGTHGGPMGPRGKKERNYSNTPALLFTLRINYKKYI